MSQINSKRILEHVQTQAFPDEMARLQGGKALKKSSHLRSLSPFLDQQLIRVGGRVGQHPILLSHDHPIAEKIVRQMHCAFHAGVEWTLSQVRKTFWLTKSRRLIRRVIHDCVTCKRLSAKPCKQIMAATSLRNALPLTHHRSHTWAWTPLVPTL